jgi:hypothetical protein
MFKAPDIAPDIEVKCGEHGHHRLSCRPHDVEANRRFAWCVFDEAQSVCSLRGWQLCREIKRLGLLDERQPSRPWWLLPNRFLNPVDGLIIGGHGSDR